MTGADLVEVMERYDVHIVAATVESKSPSTKMVRVTRSIKIVTRVEVTGKYDAALVEVTGRLLAPLAMVQDRSAISF
jgi:hypothetical protein